jgi:hypothetical protein
MSPWIATDEYMEHQRRVDPLCQATNCNKVQRSF